MLKVSSMCLPTKISLTDHEFGAWLFSGWKAICVCPCFVGCFDECAVDVGENSGERIERSVEKHCVSLDLECILNEVSQCPKFVSAILTYSGPSYGKPFQGFWKIRPSKNPQHLKMSVLVRFSYATNHIPKSFLLSLSFVIFKDLVLMRLPQYGKLLLATNRSTFFPLIVASKLARVLSGLT